MKTTTDVNLPYGLFDFMKNAGKYQQYEISDISAKIDSRLEFALGYSRQVSDRLNVGARVKFLVGIANIEANIDRMSIQMNEDKWLIQSQGTLKSSSFMDIKTKGESGAEISDPSDKDLLDFDSIKATEDGSLISGFGAAIDLGAEMEVIDGLKNLFRGQ